VNQVLNKQLPQAFFDKWLLMDSLKLKDGDFCNVIAGTHKGKSGYVKDIHKSKTGQLTITVLQENGVRFKTLAKNVVV
jgi:ribosomal protein S4E